MFKKLFGQKSKPVQNTDTKSFDKQAQQIEDLTNKLLSQNQAMLDQWQMALKVS